VSKMIYDYATKSWPIVKGCDPTMPCAERCWAKRECHRLAANPNPKIAAFHRGLTNAYGEWTGRVKLNMDHRTDPLRWKKPQRIAVAYHGDLFRATDDEIGSVIQIIDISPQHEFLFLTKCAKEARDFLLSQREYGDAWPKNIRVGFSASNQAKFDARWLHMRDLAAAGWFVWVSLEPLTGPVDISAALKQGLRWVVVGGESGPGARPMHPDWARGIRDQCRAAKVPFWFKQWGEWGLDDAWERYCDGRQRNSYDWPAGMRRSVWPDIPITNGLMGSGEVAMYRDASYIVERIRKEFNLA
jgi:protein gp37